MDYLIPGLGGFLVGAAIFGLTYQQVYPKISAIANIGAKSLPQLWDINHWLIITFFVLATVLLLYLLEKHGPLRRDKLQSPPDEDASDASSEGTGKESMSGDFTPNAQAGD